MLSSCLPFVYTGGLGLAIRGGLETMEGARGHMRTQPARRGVQATGVPEGCKVF